MNVDDAKATIDWTIRSVMEQINNNGQGIAVVVDEEDRPLATVTDGDIRRAILDYTDLDNPISVLLEQKSVDQRRPIMARFGTNEAELLRVMNEHSIRHIPLVNEAGRLISMANLSDMVRELELPMTAVVMAGGYGTRMRPLTENLPKPMLPVGDRPLLELIIEQLTKAGIQEVNLTTHYKKDMIVDHFGDGRDFGVEINYVEEDKPLGTAGSLALLGTSDRPRLVINGDILTQVDFRAMLQFHQEHNADMTVAVYSTQTSIPYGVVDVNGVEITGVREKPIINHLINAGIYLLNPSVTKFVPSGRKYDMTDLITTVVNNRLRVISFPVTEYWMDIGQRDDYAKAQVDLENGDFS